MSGINMNILRDLTRRVDKDNNNRIETNEGRVRGRVGNENGIAGVREVADAIADGSAVLYAFQLKQDEADAVATSLAGGNTWISKDDLNISNAAREAIDGQGGGAKDNKISKKEMAAALVRGGLAFNRDGITLSSEVKITNTPRPPATGGGTAGPPPLPVNPTPKRPEPPVVKPTPKRPEPPPTQGGTDRPEPPVVEPAPPRPHVPRYHYLPAYPMIAPTERRAIPQIGLSPAPEPGPEPQRGPEPEPARTVDMSEVTMDVASLLAEQGRLRKKSKFLWIFTTYPKISAAEAKSLLSAGKAIFVAPIGKGSREVVSDLGQLDHYVGDAKATKLRSMQAAEDKAYQGRLNAWNSEYNGRVRVWQSEHANRVDAWRESDMSTRIALMPAFNSVFDTTRLLFNAVLVRENGREFNRNLITATRVYDQPDTKREIASRWHQNPEMSTSDFNRMAASVVANKVANLGWNAQWLGSWDDYFMHQNPVPGLRYPDTREDVDWNVRKIQEVASELPMMLNASVLY